MNWKMYMQIFANNINNENVYGFTPHCPFLEACYFFRGKRHVLHFST